MTFLFIFSTLNLGIVHNGPISSSKSSSCILFCERSNSSKVPLTSSRRSRKASVRRSGIMKSLLLERLRTFKFLNFLKWLLKCSIPVIPIQLCDMLRCSRCSKFKIIWKYKQKSGSIPFNSNESSLIVSFLHSDTRSPSFSPILSPIICKLESFSNF
jgi:hypothetical protein